MVGSLGYSFAPTPENAEQGKTGGTPPQTSQSALQTLNYRLPSFQGATRSARAISPLVSDTQAGSNFGDAVIQSVLRTVLGPGGLDGFMGSGGANDEVGPGSDRFYAPGSRSPVASQPRDPGSDVLQRASGLGDVSRPPNPSIRPGGGDIGRVDETVPDFGKPASTAPLMPGGGTDTPSGWVQHEREMSTAALADAPTFSSVRQNKYDNGNGWGEDYRSG